MADLYARTTGVFAEPLNVPDPTPFHASEREVQALSAQTGRADNTGRVIANTIMPGAWQFLEEQEMVVLGSWDGQRGAWPTLVVGKAGFARTTDGARVHLDLAATHADFTDPLWENLALNGRISLLAIELATRRRLRINGRIATPLGKRPAQSVLEIVVEQAYPNCPKYIQRRILRVGHTLAEARTARTASVAAALGEAQVGLVATADTCFVASVHPDHGTDVSHRGGAPGFVAVQSPHLLCIPDYMGNSMFNTLGNIHATGFAGLLFMDFASGRQLQVLGDAEIDWRPRCAGVQRSWRLHIRHVRESFLPDGVAWEFIDTSPFNPAPSR